MAKKGHKNLRKKLGEAGYSEYMTAKARKSHEAQLNNVRVSLTDTLGRVPTKQEVQSAYSKVMANRLKRRSDV